MNLLLYDLVTKIHYEVLSYPGIMSVNTGIQGISRLHPTQTRQLFSSRYNQLTSVSER
jgi:hypothetical protein